MRSFACLLIVFFLSAPTTVVQAAGIGAPIDQYLYVVTPGIRDYPQYGGAGILVFDIGQGHKFIKRIATTASTIEKPRNIKGVCGHGNRLYFTTPEKLYCVDIVTEKTLWEVSPPNGCDRMSILPDGKLLYVPSFEKDTWNVINAENGQLVTEIETKSGAHNTVVSRDGTRMYLGGLKSPNIFVADTQTHKVIQQIGPFSGAIRPFTINADRTRAFVCVNDLLGFEIGDLRTGKVLHRVEVAGFKPGAVKRHGCPSHGVGLTPDEREVWVVDAANEHVHVFDNSVSPPKQVASIKLREQPGWITFSMDGQFAYPSTGEVISTKTKKIVATLTDETGREVHSEKMLEVHRRWGSYPDKFGDQFGVGRASVKFQRGPDGHALSATVHGLPLMFTPQYGSVPGDAGKSGEQYITDAMNALNFSFLDSLVQVTDHANRTIVKLNFVVASEELAAQVPAVMKRHFQDAPPPLSIVVGNLNGAAVSVDAVAVYDHQVSQVFTDTLEAAPGMIRVSPMGSRFFISGHAEKGSTPAEATTKTLASLKETLKWLGCDMANVLHARCFVSAEIVDFNPLKDFWGNQRIPVSFVGVDKSAPYPIEIELIAQAPTPDDSAPAVEFLTPPHLKASPTASRVVRVNRGNLIFTSGLFNESPKPDEQVLGVLNDLKGILKKSGSDFPHLIKANYYVSNDRASQSLRDLLPRMYSPKSPPSASQSKVSSAGSPKRGLVMDAIAITQD